MSCNQDNGSVAQGVCVVVGVYGYLLLSVRRWKICAAAVIKSSHLQTKARSYQQRHELWWVDRGQQQQPRRLVQLEKSEATRDGQRRRNLLTPQGQCTERTRIDGHDEYNWIKATSKRKNHGKKAHGFCSYFTPFKIIQPGLNDRNSWFNFLVQHH